MRLPFENWLAEQDFGAESKELFSEAVTCFKSGAYRGAMLLSYLGFQTVVRDRILAAPAPAGMPASAWASIQTEVRRDDAWDAATFDAIQRQKPAPVFGASDDVRNQVTYWKNRRNDCAHAKRNAISQSHIEAFWLFVQSNLPRIVVNGSRAALLGKIEQHFDPSVTPVGVPVTHLIAEINTAVEPSELKAFLADVDVFFRRRPKQLFATYPKEGVQFFGAILRGKDGAVADETAALAARSLDLLLPLLRSDPGVCWRFVSFPTAIRKVWHDRLFENGRDDLEVLCAMVSTGAIPPTQVEEALRCAIEKFHDEVPTAACELVLEQHGFYELFKECAFGQELIDDFDWGNGNVEMVVRTLTKVPIDESIVRAISSVFDKHNYPFALRDRLEEFFAAHPMIRDAVKAKIAAIGVPVPEYIPALQ